MEQQGEKRRNVSRTEAIRRIWRQFDALRLGMDWTEEDFGRLHILIDDVYGDSHPGSFHLDRLSREVERGVFSAAGRPVHFHITDLCDGWGQAHAGMNYILPSRDVICDMVELHGSVIPWDGMVLISSCDKSIPAHLMAAARLGIPAVHVPGGSMRPGPGLTTSALAGEISLREKQGELDPGRLRQYCHTGAPSCGACQFLGTASTMQCMSEALGMALPGSALSPATMQEILRGARAAGKAAVQLAQRGIKPADILSEPSFRNAIIVHAAIGGSTNALLHLPAIAAQLGRRLPLELFDQANRRIPYIANLQPSGRFPTELFWFAGGVPMVQWLLRDELDLSALTVTGKTLGENLEDLRQSGFFEMTQSFLRSYSVQREQVIKDPESSDKTGSVAILKGNLAPDGAVVKYAAVPNEMLQHTGPARVFECEEDCYTAVVKRDIEPGTVLIIRNEGPRGSGMPEMFMTTEALAAEEHLAVTTALVTDGRFSGGTKGPCIGHVCPEAASGGPIAGVRDGDLIKLDIPGRRLEVIRLAGGSGESPEEIAEILLKRAAAQRPKRAAHMRRGILARYAQTAAPASEGAYMRAEAD